MKNSLVYVFVKDYSCADVQLKAEKHGWQEETSIDLV